MRFAANIWVKDEVEMILPAIAHMRAIGVGDVVVCDLGSTDGTTGLLRARAAQDEHLQVLELSAETSLDSWVQTAMAAIHALEVDWVVFADADEFPIPATGDLRTCTALETADVVVIDRYNAPIRPEGPPLPEGARNLLLIAQPLADYWQRVAAGDALSWMHSRVFPKVMARPSLIVGPAMGAHAVLPRAGRTLRHGHADDVVTAHLPFTTLARFARKVANVRLTLARHRDWYEPHQARHWRSWAALPDEGAVREEFDRMVFDAATVAGLRAAGVLRTPAEIFSDRGVAARA